MLSHHSLTRENKRAPHSEASRFHKIRGRRDDWGEMTFQNNLCDLSVLCGDYFTASLARSTGGDHSGGSFEHRPGTPSVKRTQTDSRTPCSQLCQVRFA